MKVFLQVFAVSFLLFASVQVEAQNTENGKSKVESKLGLYYWDVVFPMVESDLLGNDSGNIVLSEPKQKFRVVRVTDDYKAILVVLDYTIKNKNIDRHAFDKAVIYQVKPNFYKYNFSGDPQDFEALNPAYKNSKNYGSYQRYFKINLSDLDTYATKDFYIPGALAFGIINYPFKYRPQKGKKDFTGAFNFGAAIGYTFQHKAWRRFKWSMISGYSISNTVLDSISTAKNQQDLLTTNNFTAFSFSLGGLVEFEKIQAGLFIGWDRISRITEAKYNWQYQGKPWLSIGFGYAIFSTEKATESKAKNQEE